MYKTPIMPTRRLLKAFRKHTNLTNYVLLGNTKHLYQAQYEGEKVIVKIFDLHEKNRKFWRCYDVHLALVKNPHKNIIRTIIIDNPNCYGLIVMPHIEGSDWFHHIVSNVQVPFDPMKIFRNFLQMVQAVQHLHNIGFLHLDIKLENFLRDKDGRPILIDFDLSAPVNTPFNGFRGTEIYVAPEIYKNVNKIRCVYPDEKCDVFSLGVTLYSMLFHAPFFGDERTAKPFRKRYRKVGFDDFFEQNKNVYSAASNFKNRFDQVQKGGEIYKILKGMLHYKPEIRWSMWQVELHVKEYLENAKKNVTASRS